MPTPIVVAGSFDRLRLRPQFRPRSFSVRLIAITSPYYGISVLLVLISYLLTFSIGNEYGALKVPFLSKLVMPCSALLRSSRAFNPLVLCSGVFRKLAEFARAVGPKEGF